MVIVGGAGNNWGALFGALLIYIVWMMSDPLAQALFNGHQRLVGRSWAGAPSPRSSRARCQMRVFVLGLVITIALRYAPKGLLPERIKRHD